MAATPSKAFLFLLMAMMFSSQTVSFIIKHDSGAYAYVFGHTKSWVTVNIGFDDDDNDDNDNSSPSALLRRVGTALCYLNTNNKTTESSSSSLLSSVESSKAYLSLAGNAFYQAAHAWDEDIWEEGVTEAMDEASVYFTKAASLFPEDETPSFFALQRIAKELKEVADVGGCMSIGPVASLPHWEALHEAFFDLALSFREKDAMMEKESKVMEQASKAMLALVENLS